MVGVEQPTLRTPGIMKNILGALQTAKDPLNPTSLTTPKNLEAPNRRELEVLIDVKMRQKITHLEGMVNKAVEATFMDDLTCALAVVYDKKHEKYLLTQNVVVDVVKVAAFRCLSAEWPRGR